jgi:hypothetical protein
MARTGVPINIRFPPEMRATLDRLAREDMRSLNSMVVKALAEWLREHGHLDEPPAPAPARGRKKG